MHLLRFKVLASVDQKILQQEPGKGELAVCMSVSPSWPRSPALVMALGLLYLCSLPQSQGLCVGEDPQLLRAQTKVMEKHL